MSQARDGPGSVWMWHLGLSRPIILPFFMCLIAPVFAQDTIPVPKPVNDRPDEPAPARSDVPRNKPVTSEDSVRTVPKGALAAASCEISGAVFVRSRPVSGGAEGDLLDDEACGIGNPVSLYGVKAEGEARFPKPALVSCMFAQTVSDWLLQDVMPAAREHVASSLSVIGSGPGYQCRRRNNLPDGKLSEHALGNALDVTHFVFADGSEASVAEDWGSDTSKGRFLQEVHAAACRRFTTVLGPDADPNHKTHLHLDIGCHGQDCTYIICQ
ncbi:extensin family protein [Labrenzia sp. VG12]|uniref:extensin-like domain-containing protein n=1 Tax=Labrenzia sp. VG12 TaxID=2021862 RepID=UPI0012FE2FF8|nr:extensin family protein [Labrenzia sp. VG12]